MKKMAPDRAVFIPRITVFISSACIMIVEIVAGRMIARFLGTTLYVWTSVIGVVLGGITIGNYIGGKIADSKPARESLAVLFGLSSVACVAIVLLNPVIGNWPLLWLLPWPVRVLLHVMLVFLVPSTLLGTISPVVAKMALDLGRPQGNTIGNIYAWGAAGSIFGTFIAGFFLIAIIGTQAIIWSIGAILICLAIAYRFKFVPFYPWAGLFIVLALFAIAPVQWAAEIGRAAGLRETAGEGILFEDESEYCYIAVEQVSKDPDIRQFIQDDQRSHSKIEMGNIDNIQYSYVRMFAAAAGHIADPAQRHAFLSIGGGGFVFPRYLEKHYPGSSIDVVEIDPAVKKAAIAAFGLDSDTSIVIHNEDARTFVNTLAAAQADAPTGNRYDIIFGDAFSASFVPFQLTTKEYHDLIYGLLTDDGVYVVNSLDLYTSGAFIGTFINTMKKTFPHVYVMSEYTHFYLGRNFIVFASKTGLDIESIARRPELAGRSVWVLDIYETNSLVKKSNGVILTDDYAPVDQLLSPFVVAHSKYIIAQNLFAHGDLLVKEGKWREGVDIYKDIANRFPELSITVYSKLGEIYAQRRMWDDVVTAGKQAIEYGESTRLPLPLADIHYTLGIILTNLGRTDESIIHLNKAINLFTAELKKKPDSADLHFKCGSAYGYLGNFNEGIPFLERAIAIDPANPEIRLTLATGLMILERDAESKKIATEGIHILSQKGDEEGAQKLREFLDTYDKKRDEYRKAKTTA